MRQRIGGWLAALCLLWAGEAPAVEFQHPGGVVTAAQIERARLALAAGEQPWTSAWTKLIARANSGLNEVPSAVVIFHDPGYYNDPVAHDAAKKNLRDDVNSAYACALAAAIGHGLSAGQKETYRAKARALLDNWANVNTSVSGPPDQPDNGKLVMAYIGTAFVTTAELLYEDPNWTAQDRTEFSNWTDTVLDDVARIAFETLGSNGTYRPSNNNWASWGVFAGLAGAHWRNDSTAVAKHAARLKVLIDSQIATNGQLPEEDRRGDKALWYTYFSLAPMTHAVYTLRNATGEDLFAYQPPSGGTIRQALDSFYQRAKVATGDWSVKPQQSEWGGDLLWVMAYVYPQPDWRSWARPPFGLANSAWKSADLLPPTTGGTAPPAPPPAAPAAPQLLD